MKPLKSMPGEASVTRAWYSVWVAALAVLGMSSALRWFVLASSGTAAIVAEIVQIGAVVVGVVAVLRWAVLHER